MLEKLYFISGIIISIPIIIKLIMIVRKRYKKYDSLIIKKNEFIDSKCDLAKIYESRYHFSQNLFNILELAQEKIIFAAMGAATLVDLRGKKYFESFLSRKMSDPNFKKMTIVMWNPDYSNFLTRLNQLKETDKEYGIQNVKNHFNFFKEVQNKFTKFEFRSYKDFFQPVFLYLCIDDQFIWMSPYFNEIAGKHSPLVFEFHKGGSIFRELYDQIQMLIKDNYTEIN